MWSRQALALALTCLSLVGVVRARPAQEEIPFQLVRGFAIVVKGSVGSSTSLNFLVDTGAVPSVISRSLASRIGVWGTLGPFALLGQQVQARYVNVSDVRFGSIRRVNLDMVAVDLAPLENLIGLRIDAIIGLDCFAGRNLTIDYKHHTILLEPEDEPAHTAPAEVRTLEGVPYWVLTINLDGRDFRVLLDTGADHLGLFAGRLPEAFPGGAHGTTADSPFGKQQVVVLSDPPASFPDIDGVCGPAALGITRMELDWEHHRLRWERK